MRESVAEQLRGLTRQAAYVPSLPPYSEYDEVNRLIIVGNGFDMAHSLRSSFKDFIYHYCKTLIGEAARDLRYSDPLISLRFNQHFVNGQSWNFPMEGELALNTLLALRSAPGVFFRRNSEFFWQLLQELVDKSWVDIEVAYFSALKEFVRSHKLHEITKLNMELVYIKTRLSDYLRDELRMLKTGPSHLLQLQFSEKINPQHCQPSTVSKELVPKHLCVLNFNYTNLAQRYVDSHLKPSDLYIPIHGQLDGDDVTKQGPIFGFGDELDRDYVEFEHQSNDEVFKHIKSFKYLQFSHYRKLLEFINAGPFQVQLFGHSCGLSDRTLLNTIFENENCISIKLFYHRKEYGDDYEEKTFAISRHFASKAALRSKVVNKEFCEPMAQPNQEQHSM